MKYNPKKHLENAKSLSQLGGDDRLRYACLELRYCIEAVVYSKLSAQKNIPNTVLKTWQPTKALKMLSKIDELADKSCSIEFNLSDSETLPEEGWLRFGKQEIPSVKWLNKNYNKLGSFLHLPKPNDSESIISEKLEKCCQDLISQLERFVDGTVWVSLPKFELQPCFECSEYLVFDKYKASAEDIVKCDGCSFEYKVISIADNKLQLTYDVRDVKCTKCNEIIEIDNNQLVKNLEFTCNECGQKHEVIKSYQYGASN